MDKKEYAKSMVGKEVENMKGQVVGVIKSFDLDKWEMVISGKFGDMTVSCNDVFLRE